MGWAEPEVERAEHMGWAEPKGGVSRDAPPPTPFRAAVDGAYGVGGAYEVGGA